MRFSREVSITENQNFKQKEGDRFEVRAFPHPEDINWRNVKPVYHSMRIVVKVLLFTLSLILLLFVTTPSALIQIFSTSNTMKLAINLAWAQRLPLVLKFLLNSFMPPLLVIIVNQLLLLIIYYLGGLS